MAAAMKLLGTGRVSLGENGKEVPLPSRAAALLAVASMAGPLDPAANSRTTIANLKRWIKGFPKSLASEFKEAEDQLVSATEDQLAVWRARWCLVGQPLPDVLASIIACTKSPVELKRKGAVFTPEWLAKRVTRNALGHWSRLHRSGRQPMSIADLSCGPGAFLHAFAGTQAENARVFGVDIDPDCCALARLLTFSLGKDWAVHQGDALLQNPPTKSLFDNHDPNIAANGPFDILIGNPPYVRSPLLPPDYVADLRGRYRTINKGNFDLSVAFIEHALHNLNEGGIASYIVSNKFMTTEYGQAICKRLSADARLIHVEDFQDYQVFQGYTTYTCVMTFARLKPVKRFVLTRFSSGVTFDRDPGPGVASTLPTSRLTEHPWHFATDRVHSILRKLKDSKHRFIDKVCGRILQGLRTGCNNVFVLKPEQASSLDHELLVPFISGEHIRRCKFNTTELQLLFPYRTSPSGDVRLIPEDELSAAYPQTYSYLLAHRNVLDDRARDSGTPWFAFSRSQNLEIGNLRKLLVREMMPRSEFAADLTGSATFASGYAIDAAHLTDQELKAWAAVFNTPTLEFSFRHTGTQLQSGWFRLMKHHLRRVRVPDIGDKGGRIVHLANDYYDEPGNLKLLNKLDSEIAKAFGLSEDDRDFIRTFLADCHARSLKSPPELYVPTLGEPSAEPAASQYEPVQILEYEILHRDRPDLRAAVTFVPNKKAGIHRWYKYTQGYSGALVHTLLEELQVTAPATVLDPFCGCGTTNVVCRQVGLNSVGVEISPLMVWVAEAKCRSWKIRALESAVNSLELPAPSACSTDGLEESVFADYLSQAYSHGILAQLWTFMQRMRNLPDDYREFLQLGVLGIMEDVSQVRKHGSHYRFMLKTESIGLQKLNTQIIDPNTDIRPHLVARLSEMLADLVSGDFRVAKRLKTKIVTADARDLLVDSDSIDAVITSPPYLNRNNYIAQQKAELAMMSLVGTKSQYRKLVQSTLRSHVEARFDDSEARSSIPDVAKILRALELTTNNNAKIPHMIAGYFDDMTAVLTELFRVMKKGAKAAFVVGNSRWGGVVVPVDHLLLRLAEQIGFTGEQIMVTRHKGNSPQQMRQYGRIPVRESIVVFRKGR